jgi:hypothetical protein
MSYEVCVCAMESRLASGLSRLSSRVSGLALTSRVLSRSRTRGKRIPYISFTTLVFVFALPLAPGRARRARARDPVARPRVRAPWWGQRMFLSMSCLWSCVFATNHTHGVGEMVEGDRRSGQCGESSRAPPSVDGASSDWTAGTDYMKL